MYFGRKYGIIKPYSAARSDGGARPAAEDSGQFAAGLQGRLSPMARRPDKAGGGTVVKKAE